MPGGRTPRSISRYRADAATLGAALKAARQARELTQEHVAAKARIAVSTLRKIESAHVVEPGFFTVLAIAQALNLPMGVLIPTRPARNPSRRSA